MKKRRTQSLHFGLTWTTGFHLKMTKIEKDKQMWGKTSALELSKYVKIQALSPLPFPGETRLLFAIFGLFLPGNRVGSQIKGLQTWAKFCKYVKTFWVQHFPVLQLWITKDISEKF